MDGAHGVRQLQGKGVHTRSSYNTVRSKIFLQKLLRRTSGVEIFCFDKGLISNFEIWGQSSTSISRALVALLSSRHFGAEEGVEFHKISHIGVSTF